MFGGSTYDHERDFERLDNQFERVFELMRDGRFRSLSEIATETSSPPSSVSARLRDMRKPQFGEHTVNRRYVANGLYEYQLVPNLQPAQQLALV